MCRRLICLFSFALVCAVQTSSAAGPEDNLVLYLPFDEGSGTVATDLASGLQATLTGAFEWTQGKLGQAVSFTGGVATLDGGDPLNPPLITAMAWVNPTAITANVAPNHYTDLDPIYEKRGSGDDSVVLGLTGGDGVHFYIDNGGNQNLSLPDAGVQLGEWQHVAGTFDGTTSRAFLNGELIGEMAASSTIITNTNTATVGGATFQGTIDEVKVFDRALTVNEIAEVMYGVANPFAVSPDPADGSLSPQTWMNLSWSPGEFALSHDVYLGDSFDDVNNGIGDTFIGNQTQTELIVGFPGFTYPDGLVPGTTYYWRIDEVNDADPNSPWKGDVWSFLIPPKTAYYPNPADGGESVDLNAQLSWAAGFGSILHTVYFGDNFDDVSNAAGGALLGDPIFTPAGPLELAKTYYWRVDEFDPPFTHKGKVWSFRTEGTAANPNPAKGAVDVSPTPILSWTPGDPAASHDVYFGADADTVKNAGKTSPEYKGTKTLGEESYDAGKLELETTYFWQIDEVNNANPDSPWIGNVWSFTTGDFLVVDDFESYNDIDPPDAASNRIFDKWIDGFGTTTNGALVGNDLPPYAEQTIVHGGAQSMICRYDNANKTSEATLTLVYPRDWTEEGVAKLSLWFRGASANAAERMFVALGNAVVYHDDPAATQTTGWKEWIIDLQAFADQGVNLANVNTITFGIGTKGSPAAGGTGTMYFDDIRLVR